MSATPRAPRRGRRGAALLAGCPLPQPLPDYPEGQPITPPRIVVDDTFRTVAYPESVVRVPAGCAACEPRLPALHASCATRTRTRPSSRAGS